MSSNKGISMPTPAVSYPFDPTGSATTNLITGEQHPVQEFNYEDFYLIVPLQAPFFTTNLLVQYTDPTTPLRQLQEGVDYNLVLPYWGATRSIGLPVYGGILILNNKLTGTISLNYQTIGGIWCGNQQYVLQNLAEQMYNPRAVLWDVLTNVQQIFPPINHSLSIDNTYGLDTLNNELSTLAATIANRPTVPVQIITGGSSSGSITSQELTQILSQYSLTTVIQNTYQPISAMGSYITTAIATSTFATINGGNAIGTWNISISGNAATASLANNVTPGATLPLLTINNLTTNVYYNISSVSINSAATTTIDCSTANYFPIVLTSNTTLAFTNVPAAGIVYNAVIQVTQDSTGGRTLTWPTNANFLWNNGTVATASTGAGQIDVYVLMTADGGANWFIGQSFKNASV